MPSALLKTYAKRSGKTIEEAEACWERAKSQAEHVFKKNSDEYWAMVNKKTRECLGISE